MLLRFNKTFIAFACCHILTTDVDCFWIIEKLLTSNLIALSCAIYEGVRTFRDAFVQKFWLWKKILLLSNDNILHALARFICVLFNSKSWMLRLHVERTFTRTRILLRKSHNCFIDFDIGIVFWVDVNLITFDLAGRAMPTVKWQIEF